MNQRAQTLRNILLQLESVLCDPEGEVCISGTPADRFEVKTALTRLAGVIEAEEEPVVSLRDHLAITASEEDIRKNMTSFDASATIHRTREQARYFYADMMLKARKT